MDSSAVLLAWKLQWILSDELPIIPLFIPGVTFLNGPNVQGIWNGYPENYQTHPGGILNFWTFQRIRHKDMSPDTIRLGMTNALSHLNPLGPGSYWDTLIWCRIYESLLGINPFLIVKGIGEDAVHLAKSFSSEKLFGDQIKQKISFKLKDDVLWHDGIRFDANDVAFTFFSLFGSEGKRIAERHRSTEDFVDVLVNENPIPSWIDLVKTLDHVEINNKFSIDIFLKERSRYSHEWFGDVPVLPMHVWKYLGTDFTKPIYNGVSGLPYITDESKISPNNDYSGWNGMIGTGPFRWLSSRIGMTDPLTEGGCLEGFKHYHYADRQAIKDDLENMR
jgi:ABC-type transport system substrate-binding protein